MLQMDRNYSSPGHPPIPPAFNTAYAPPNIPPGYGTDLYPAVNLDPDTLPAMEIEEITRNRKSSPSSNPRNLTTGISGLSTRRTSTTALNAQNIHLSWYLEKE